MNERKDFPKMELHMSGMPSDPEKYAREIKEMRMKAGLEKPDEEQQILSMDDNEERKASRTVTL